MCDTRKLADEICDYIAAPFGIGLNKQVREGVAQKIAEALKPSHNKQSTPNYACPKCGAWLSTNEYRTGECFLCHSTISA